VNSAMPRIVLATNHRRSDAVIARFSRGLEIKRENVAIPVIVLPHAESAARFTIECAASLMPGDKTALPSTEPGGCPTLLADPTDPA
jgi:hypothetical protein